MCLVYSSYFLHTMSQGIDLGSFFTNQLLSATTSSAKKIVIGGFITPIARLVGIEPILMIECLGLRG